MALPKGKAMNTTQSPSLRILIPVIICCLLMSFLAAYGQGTVSLNNRITGTLDTRVYLPESSLPGQSKYGNTGAQTPAGTQTYTGGFVSGGGWSAQLWAAPGADQPENALQPSYPITTFRTGTSAGVIAGVTATLTGVPVDSPVATVQLRVWPSGFPNWSAAEAYGLEGFPAGVSLTFNVFSIGGGTNSPALLSGLRSFSLRQGLDYPYPPLIWTQPQSQSVATGANVVLQCSYSSSGSVAYQWQLNGTNYASGTYSGGSSFGSVPETNVLQLSNVQAAQAGIYTFAITNACCSYTNLVSKSSNAVVIVGSPGTISATKAAGQVVLNWQGAFYLQSATNVSGPYSDLSGPVLFGPYTNTSLVSPTFFRLRN